MDLVFHERLPDASRVEDEPRQAIFCASLGDTDVVIKYGEDVRILCGYA